MDALTLNQIRNVQLDILKEFDLFCKEHKLCYWLAYGTMLGAVRHKGFIPWDDDIDLLMPYQDYAKFVEIINARNNGGMLANHCRVADQLVEGKHPYHQLFTKIYDTRTRATSSSLRRDIGFSEGVFIDVFALCGRPEDAAAMNAAIEKATYLVDRVWYLTISARSEGLSHPAKYLKRLIAQKQAPLEKLKKVMNEFKTFEASLPAFGTTKQCSVFSLEPHRLNRPLTTEDWLETQLVEFEGGLYPIPVHAHEILSHYYGNYMQLPPEEKRVPSHDQGYYWVS